MRIFSFSLALFVIHCISVLQIFKLSVSHWLWYKTEQLLHKFEDSRVLWVVLQDRTKGLLLIHRTFIYCYKHKVSKCITPGGCKLLWVILRATRKYTVQRIFTENLPFLMAETTLHVALLLPFSAFTSSSSCPTDFLLPQSLSFQNASSSFCLLLPACSHRKRFHPLVGLTRALH